jgi:L-ascorbate metabolism protein UlaG (beta-lactamase superfamily)
MYMRNVFKHLIFALLIATPLPVLADGTQLTWYGHAAFKLTTPSGKVLLIDPWLNNPANKNGAEDLAKLDKADLILITHGHADHVGNSAAIAKKTGAKLVATADLANALMQFGGFPAENKGMGGNFGGEQTLLDGEVKITFVPAVHSSTVTEPEGTKHIHTGGNPGGFLISVKNGPSIYHTGDTDVFSDMALIRQFQKVDLMLACIGGHFTMGPERAALAVKLVEPATVIPMHFGTYPILAGTPQALEKSMKENGAKAKMKTMTIGETIKL